MDRCPDYEKACITKCGVYVCAIEHQAADDEGLPPRKYNCPIINYRD